MAAETVNYNPRWREHVDGDDYGYQPDQKSYIVPKGAPALPMAPPEPLRRTFDLRTSEERLVMWCASLERRIEDQAARITGLELTNEKQARHIEHLELVAHRWLNAGEVPEYPQVEP